MATNAFNIKIDVSNVEGLADTLGKLTPEHIGEITIDAINSVADKTYDISRKTILRGVNLTDSYVQRRMVVEHATKQKPEAAIIAFGGKSFLTSLSHYGAMQQTQAVTWTNERILADGHKFGKKWPGWIRRTGDAARGIAVGEKTGGVSVNVTSRKQLKTSKAIIVPNIKDRDGNSLVFKRVGGSGRKDSKLQALTGPSVYQMFRTAIPLIQDEAFDNLEREVTDAAVSIFEKELT